MTIQRPGKTRRSDASARSEQAVIVERDRSTDAVATTKTHSSSRPLSTTELNDTNNDSVFEKRIEYGHYELVDFEHAPTHLQLNNYIIMGYRPLLSIRLCFQSLFHVHNEVQTNLPRWPSTSNSNQHAAHVTTSLSERERERERESVCVCVCVLVLHVIELLIASFHDLVDLQCMDTSDTGAAVRWADGLFANRCHHAIDTTGRSHWHVVLPCFMCVLLPCLCRLPPSWLPFGQRLQNPESCMFE
jgi:hypothetical protein